MRGHDCLRLVCSDVDLCQSEYATSIKLGKYVATVCQVFNLSTNEYDWLCRYVGHDIRVYGQYYKLHKSAVELAKISRLILAEDQGEANILKAKKLQEINLEGTN